MNLTDIFSRFKFWRSNYNDGEYRKSLTDPIDPNDEYDQNFQRLQNYVNNEMAPQGLNGAFGSFDYMSWISMVEKSKDDRIALYREMEQNAYVGEALDEIVYSAYNEDEEGKPTILKIHNQNLAANANIRDNLIKEYEHIMYNVLDYKKNFFRWFREFVLMGEFALEKIIDDEDGLIMDNGITAVRQLLAEEFVAKYHPNGELDTFVIRNMWNNDTRLLADATQISYMDSGKYDYMEGVYPSYAQRYVATGPNILRLPKSFIDNAKKPYKQLDSLEDANIINKLARAPARLVFNVSVGNLPKNKSEQYLQKLINKYRKKLTYHF